MPSPFRWPAAGALCTAVVLALAPSGGQAAPPSIRDLAVQTTEEGQSVVYDRYTWQRRELAKRLPLDEPWPSEAMIAEQFKRFGLDRPQLPETIEIPSRITTDVYLVNSRTNLTYLIDGGPEGLILIDPGPASNVDALLDNISRLGFAKTAVKWVINTHAHYDHAMADARFRELGAKILIGRGDVAAVEKGTGVTARFALPPTRR